MAYLDNTGVGTLWNRIKTYISGLGFYTKPSTGIPASDIASGVIPIVPTTLSSFTDDLGSSPTHTHSQYLTSAPVTSVNGQTGAVSLSIPTVPSNVSAFTNDAGYTTNTGTVTSTGGTVAVNNIQVVSALPASPDANTLYLIPES